MFPRRRPVAERIGLAGYNFLAMVRRGLFYTFLLVYLRERLGMPVTLVALIGAGNSVASTVGQVFFWGRLSDRTDRRAGLMIRGEAIAGIGYLVTFGVYSLCLPRLPPAITTLLLVSCLATVEFFWSMTDVGYRSALAQVTTRADRGKVLGFIDFTGLLGTGAGLFVAGLLYDRGEGFENGSLWILAAGFILAGIPLIRFTLLHLDGVRDVNVPPPAEGVLTPVFRRYALAFGVAVLGLWSFQQIHNYYVRLPSTAAAGDTDLSLIRTAFFVAAGLTAPFAGRLIDRFGAGRAYVGALLLAALVPLTFPFTGSVLFAVVGMAIFGAALGAFRSSSYALAADLTPEGSRGRHFAIYNGVLSLGWGGASLVVGGPVSDLALAAGATEESAYATSFVAGALLGLLGLLLFLFLVRPAASDQAG